MQIERISNINIEEFKKSYLSANKPVIITDGMVSWKSTALWSPTYFCENFGDELVQIYDNLFNLIDISPLNNYIEQYFGKEDFCEVKNIPYVRWYTRLKDEDFVWADVFFEKIKPDWGQPYFLPDSNYFLPYCPSPNIVSPVHHAFPAKGIFISAKGAKTKLHQDPWCSDAILCQVYGRKDVTMYSPDQAEYLSKENKCIDIDHPDLKAFPNFSKATPTFSGTLMPGEILFIPHRWFHHVSTISDSISITWNFVHASTGHAFFKHLIMNDIPQEEMVVIKFFLENPIMADCNSKNL